MLEGEKVFKTKDLSKQLGVARLSFADPADMEKYLDITPGSVSVLGLMNDTENAVQLVLDKPIAEAARTPDLRVEFRDGVQRMFLDGEDVSDAIRMPEISIYASDVSAVPEVRVYLMEMQRSFARTQNVIMDGRDIGTVVLPDAGLKIFLTASVEARARRRQLELEKKGKCIPLEEVLRDMEYRDKNDSSRAAAPLRPAEDAVRLDTTQLDFDESCAAVESLIRERFAL